MNHTAELQRINDKYYSKIKSTYGCYIKNVDKIPNMTQKVYIVPDANCAGKHSDLSLKRAKCITKSGKIYIRESAFDERILIHEYIHRLSRNYKHKAPLNWGWVEGFSSIKDNISYVGFNELITEWITYDITHIKEPLNPYQVLFPIIAKIQSCLGNDFEKIIQLYFQGNCNPLFDIIYLNVYYPQPGKNMFNEISEFLFETDISLKAAQLQSIQQYYF